MDESQGITTITLLLVKTFVMDFPQPCGKTSIVFKTLVWGTWHPVSPEVCSLELTEHATHCHDALQGG